MALPIIYELGPRPFHGRGNGKDRKPRNNVKASSMQEEETMTDNAKRAGMGFFVRNISGMLGRKDKVKTDSELEQKAREYFDYCAETGLFPIIESFSLYVGYSSVVINEWSNGRNQLIHDIPGEDTVSTMRRVKTAFASLDGYLAMDGSANTVAYIFRAKNYYDMVNEDRVRHQVDSMVPTALPTDEIARLVGGVDEEDDEDIL